MTTADDVPRRLGNRYEVGEVLGRGGMAEVHLSRDSRLGRLVAVKMLRSDLARDPVFQARFRREAHSAAALNHPSVVAVYDTGEDSFTDSHGVTARLPYIVMEHVAGKTAKELLQEADGGGRGSGLGLERATDISAGVLTALDYSHRQGIIHRDIKPANVMVTADGAVKVMDFGIARALADTSATMTQTSAVIGTAQYLSPEQARGETVDARSDLYSCGCLLYELLTGRPPFVGDSPVSVAYQHVREVPQPASAHNPAVTDALDRVVLKALAKDRDDRYADAESFRRDLLAAAGGHQVLAPAVGVAAAMATQVVPRSADATQAMAAAGLGGGLAAAGAGPATGATRLGQPVDDPLAALEPPGARSARRHEEEPPRRRAGVVVLLVLALVAALALLGVVVWNLTGAGAADEPTEVTVPSVVGQQEDEARTALTAARLELVLEQREDAAPAGTVVDQDPAGGQLAPLGSDVRVAVSTGPAAVQVPDVAGNTESQASDNLVAAGLRAGERREEPSPDVAEGRVIRTEPAAGDPVPPGTEVVLVLSTGEVVVEDYTGIDVLTARTALTGLGLEVVLRQEPRDDVPVDSVVGQDPPPGPVEPGSTVTLVVAQAPPTPTASPSESDGTDGGEDDASPSSSPSEGPTR